MQERQPPQSIEPVASYAVFSFANKGASSSSLVFPGLLFQCVNCRNSIFYRADFAGGFI